MTTIKNEVDLLEAMKQLNQEELKGLIQACVDRLCQQEEEFVEGDTPVGSVWECVRGELRDVVIGNSYTIHKVDAWGDPVFYDDEGDYRDPGRGYFLENFKRIK